MSIKSKHKNFTLIDLRDDSGLSRDDLKLALANTPLSKMVDAFVLAEQQYRINALYLCAHAVWESAWGMSKLARVKHNLFGICEDKEFPYLTAVVYPDYVQCILDSAKYISKNYLDPEGKFFNGSNINGIKIYHANGDRVWEDGVNMTMNILLARIKNAKDNLSS